MVTPSIKFCKNSHGQRIAYSVYGNGPPLVFTAWWVSHLERDFRNPRCRNFFDSLAEHCTVIRYDRVGVGLSDPDRHAYTLEEATTELATIIDASGFHRVNLMGLSCGGPPSIRFAQKNPTQVDRLIFFGSYVDGPTVATEELQTALQNLIRAHWGIGSRAMADLFAPNLSTQDVRLLGANQRHSCSAETAAHLLGMGFTMSARSFAADVEASSLVIHRQGDQTVGFERGRELAMELPDSTFLPLEGDSHVPWEGEYGEVVEAIIGFLDCPRGLSAPATPSDNDASLTRRGELWELRFAGRRVHIKHSKGLADLALLLTHPHREFPAIDLMVGSEQASCQGRAQNMIDEQARRNYRARLKALEESLEEAENNQDLGYLERIREEREFLLAELSSSLGLGGRQRKFNRPEERARKAVSARIRSTLKKVAQSHAKLGEHLKSSVSTGLHCSYRPTPGPTIEWIVR